MIIIQKLTDARHCASCSSYDDIYEIHTKDDKHGTEKTLPICSRCLRILAASVQVKLLQNDAEK